MKIFPANRVDEAGMKSHIRSISNAGKTGIVRSATADTVVGLTGGTIKTEAEKVNILGC
jgi:hypothetical protein